MSELRLLALFVTACATACVAPPLDPAAMEEPELRRIHRVFVDVVAELKSDPKFEWVHGWEGNTRVNESSSERVRGLCWEWSDHVFATLGPFVRAQGWEAVQITINNQWFSEHHAVLVFDPTICSRDEILAHPDLPGYVLDAWRNGRPEIWTLADWVDTPVIVFAGAALE